MSVVCTTAVVTIEPQELACLKDSPFVHQSQKKLRRLRKSGSFQHVIWKMPSSRAVFLIYRTGKVVILGTTSICELRDASSWLASALKSKIIEKECISNIVYSCKRDFTRIKNTLQTLFNDIRQYNDGAVRYEPELSPALIFKPKTCPSVTVMIFRTGNITITGLKNKIEIADTCKCIDTVLNR